MKLAFSIRLSWLYISLLAGLLILLSGDAAAPVVANAHTTKVSLPWTMTGCWENELFTLKSTAPVAQR